MKVDKPSFCKFYGEIKKTLDREKYWYKKKNNGGMEEEWARLRCGIIGKVGKKGYEDWNCRICGKEDESTLEPPYKGALFSGSVDGVL